MKTAVVISAQGAGTYDSSYGTLNVFEYTLEAEGNQFTVKANHQQTSKPFEKGATVDYIITHPSDGSKPALGLIIQSFG